MYLACKILGVLNAEHHMWCRVTFTNLLYTDKLSCSQTPPPQNER